MCPLSITPNDRKMTREQYRYLHRIIRIIWRKHGDAWKRMWHDTLVFGSGSMEIE